ncbi:MAG: SIS domain-containing protein [Verrucomicrobia bacterium]|nr:SIS domain-containing protein [Verrucomicrobiota bacterium]
MNLSHDLSALEETVKRCRELLPKVEKAGRELAERVRKGGKVLTCGNGGSAADAMHIAEEMTGRYRGNRQALPALCLAADGSALTCIGNDWSYEDVFSRQVEAFGRPEDVLIIFSTSGKSPNILKALEVAKSRNMLRIGALGKGGGPALPLCDHAIVVPSDDTSRIQEIHGWLIHAWLECVEALAVGKS